MTTRTTKRFDLIKTLVEEGVLGRELCPQPNFWHWDVLRPDLLPIELVDHYKNFGEVRWYGTEG